MKNGLQQQAWSLLYCVVASHWDAPLALSSFRYTPIFNLQCHISQTHCSLLIRTCNFATIDLTEECCNCVAEEFAVGAVSSVQVLQGKHEPINPRLVSRGSCGVDASCGQIRSRQRVPILHIWDILDPKLHTASSDQVRAHAPLSTQRIHGQSLSNPIQTIRAS